MDVLDGSARVMTSHLLPGERLLWIGQPKQGLLLRAEDIWLIPFSLVWNFNSFSGISSTLASGQGRFDPITILFLAVGFYLLVGRFLVDMWFRSRAYYGLTNERAIIVTGTNSLEARSIYLKTMSNLKMTKRGNGCGTIEFDKPKFSFFGTRASRAVPWPGTGQYINPAFEMITDVRRVHDLIIQIQHQG